MLDLVFSSFKHSSIIAGRNVDSKGYLRNNSVAVTAWLLVRGGEDVGAHLSLLGQYFPGYVVSWPGAFLGLLYGGLVGAVVGWLTAWIYNTLANLRS